MAISKAAVRYAQALLDLALEQKVADKVNNDMVTLNALCAENHELETFLSSPIIPKNKKVEIFDVMFEGKVEKMSLNFFKLITKNKRENLLNQIAESYVELFKTHSGIVDVHITSAIKLEDNVKDQILAKVQEKYTGKKLAVHQDVDASLIGGFVVGVDGMQLDASIASQLTNLKNILLN
jgi:F-type H+-transporting ATPase subunit delta